MYAKRTANLLDANCINFLILILLLYAEIYKIFQIGVFVFFRKNSVCLEICRCFSWSDTVHVPPSYLHCVEIMMHTECT